MKFMYPAVFRKNEDGTYNGYFPDLECCTSTGDTLWIVSLIALVLYLICVEYIHDKIRRQMELGGITSEDLVHVIEEEKER